MAAEKRMSVTDQAMETLREKILAGEYRLGDKLPPETALTEALVLLYAPRLTSW